MPLNARDLWLFLRAKNMGERELKKFAHDIRDAGKAVRLAELQSEKAAKRSLLTQQNLTQATKQAELAHLQRSKALQTEAIRLRQADEAMKRLEISNFRLEKSELRNELALERLTTKNKEHMKGLRLQILELDEVITANEKLLVQHEEQTARVKEHVGALDLDILAKRKDIETTKLQTIETRKRIAAIDDETRMIKNQIKEFKMKKELDRIADEEGAGFFRRLLTPNRQVLATLRTGIPAVLSSPIGLGAIALGGLFVASFVSAVITAFATAGLGAVIVGAAVAGLLATDEKVKGAANRWVETIKGVFTRSIKPMAAPLIGVFGLFEESLKRLEPTFTKISEALAPAITPLAEGMIGFVEEFLKVLTADPKTMQDIADALTEMGRQLPGLGKSLGEFFKTLSENEDNIRNIGAIFTTIENILKALAATLSFLATEYRKFVDFWNETTNDLREEWDIQWDAVVTSAKDAVTAIKEEWEIWKGAAQSVGNFFQGPFVNFFKLTWNSIINGVRMVNSEFQHNFLQIVSFVGSIVNRIVGAFASLPGRILAIFRQIINIAFDAGAQIVENVAAGIRSRIPSAASAAAALGAIIRRFLPGSPVEEGPLKILNNGRAGQEIVKMLASGISSGSSLLGRTISSLMEQALKELLSHIHSGGEFFEDFSFSGMNPNLRRVNERLAKQFRSSGQEFSRTTVERFLSADQLMRTIQFAGPRGSALYDVFRESDMSMRRAQELFDIWSESAEAFNARRTSFPGSTQAAPGNVQNFFITTQEIDPRVHSAQLGWELAGRL